MAVQEDRFDALDDDALLQHLVDVAAERRERLFIDERDGAWIAETVKSGGLSGRTVMLGAAGPDRRSAMLGLARKFEANRF
ncbi:MAG: hypothetical protein ACRDPA_13285 [Solirubrobacteraceae bacterium]